MKRYLRKISNIGIYILLDMMIIIAIQLLGFYEIGLQLNTEVFSYTLLFIFITTGFKLATMIFFKIYNMITDNFGISESLRLLTISSSVSILVYVVMLMIPKTIVASFDPIIFIFIVFVEAFLLTSSRYARRILKLYRAGKNSNKKIRTMIIGAGAGGKLVFDEARTNSTMNNKIVVFVDDEIKKIGKTFDNIPIKGPLENVAEIVREYECDEIIIAIANLSKNRLFDILRLLDGVNVKIKRLPLMSELDSSHERRIMDIDINELLCRDAITLNNDDIEKFIENQNILVTGAGGSIGSELVRQIFAFKPKKIILFDIYENNVYDLQQCLLRKMKKHNITDIDLITLIGSTYNEQRLDGIFKEHRITLVFHAAAYKHVPLMEDSPMEAIRTNVLGTYNIAKMCDKYQVQKMVLVSTDKAVRPTNVMGATKRFAELIIQYYASKSKCNYSAVRFGNVLGSNGSVIPLFKKQIDEGGPVTVTDANMTRFFMSIPEAVGLILQSGAYASGGEIFILDMGEPIKILDLAEKLIRQSGYMPYRDIKIEFTGLRPGEKMYEELLLEVSKHTKTANDKIFVEEKNQVHPIEDEIAQISKVFSLDSNQKIKDLLKQIIDTYQEIVHI